MGGQSIAERVKETILALTLGAFVSPLSSHSLTSGGALMHAALACSTQGSLIIFTVKPFPDLMLFVLSFACSGPLLIAMEIVGGLDVTMLNQLPVMNFQLILLDFVRLND